MKQIDYLRKSRKNCSALLMACALTFMLLTTTLSFAQTNSLTLGCPTRNGSGDYLYSNLDLNAGDGVVRSISISFSDDPDGCSIDLPDITPPGWSIASSSIYSTYITLPEGVSATDIENYLRLVSFRVPNNTIRSVSIIMQTNISGNVIYYSDNGHYYQYVPFTNSEMDWTWIDCYNAAKEMTYCGRQGYLATLTSLDEDKFVTRLVSTPMWVGGTRLSPTDNDTSSSTQYYASFDTGDEPNADDTDYWYWACGPEKGMQITPGVKNPYQGASQHNDAVTWWNTMGAYSNWMCIHTQHLWQQPEHEPNNYLGNGGESCLVILSLSNRNSEEGHTPGFGWADIGYDVNAIGNGDSYGFDPDGYLVEYGDQFIGDSQPQENECSISASGLVGNATHTVRATLSGDTAVCAGKEATLNIIFEDGAFPFTGSVQGNNGAVVHTFNTNDISYNFTVAPTATTSYTISTFSDASSTTGSNGCPGVYSIVYEKTGSATVTVNTPQVALNDIAPVAICAGASTTLTAELDGTPTGNVAYAWSIGATENEITVTPSETTTYTVTATATQGGCAATATKEVTVTVNELTVEVSVNDALCNGASNGSVELSVSGGTTPYSYVWSNGATTEDLSSVSVGTYTVTVTDANGCTTTASATVSQPSALTVSLDSENETCAGNDGTATVAATGGNGDYSFEWSNGQNSATATDLSSFTNGGVYTVTVSDVKGCTNVQNVTITLNNPLAMEPITGPAVCTGTEFSITPQNGTNGTIPAGTTYSWPTPDAIPGIGGLAAGTNENRIHGVLTNNNSTPQTVSYVVTPKNGVCVGNAVGVSVTVTTTVNPNVTINMPNAMTVCSNADNFNLSATFVNSVSNSTVVWKKDGTTMATHTVTGNTDNYTIDLDNSICKGQYIYRVEYTDVSGCTASDECVITVNAGDWSISQPAGTATIECVSDTTEPAESLLPVVEDGCGRTTTRTFLRRESNPTEITCAGTVTYTYRYTACDDTYKDWTYTYTINDVTNPTIAADAITTKAANIDQTACKFSIPDLTADIRAKASDNCTEADDLVISQSLAMGTVITAATDVVVTVTDKCGKSTTHTVNVTVPTLPTATIAPTHILCHGNTTGSATVTPAKGTAPYTYLWSNSQTVATATELDNKEYTVTVTDANGCTTTASVTITEPAALVATTATVPVDCYRNSTGSATITVTGGTPSYSVIVNEVTKSGNDALTFENLPKGTYPVTIKDANDCELTGVSITITEPEALAISVELTQVKCKDGNNGAIDLTVTGGNGSYQYVWNNDATTQDLTNLTAGEYNVTVKDAKNCSISGTYTIVEPDLLQITSITPTNITCPSGNDGKIEVAVTGGTTPYSYQLNGGDAQSSAVFDALIAGSYTVTVTDANGCSTTSSTTLTQPTPLTLTGCPTNITVNTDADKSYATVTWTEPTFSPIGNGATLNVTGDTATNQYSVGTTTITYTVTNTCGESQSCSFTIAVSDNQAPEITCTVTGNQDVFPNSAGNTYTHSGNSWNATATDNVDVVSLTYTLTGATVDNTPKTTLDGQVFNYGTTTVTWKATDNTGAIDECSFQVVVADNTKPELTCPTITAEYECLASVPDTYANYAAFAAAGGIATDNHQINESSLTVTETVVTGCPTTITRTYSIKDMTGNEGTCTQVITVEDKTAPALKSGSTLPAGESNMSLCFDSIPAGPTVEEIAALYEDNCGGEVIVSKSGTPTGDDCGWNVTYTYVIKDTCNNEAIDTVSYSGKAADFVMPANGTKTVQCIDDAAPTLPVIKDACGTVLEPKTSSMVDSPSPLICEGTRTYTYTYEDCAGHTHDWTYTYTIEREDFTIPADTGSTVACIDDATVPTAPSVTDNCGNVLTPSAAVEGGTYDGCEGTRTYTFTYTDCEGNTHDWVYTYTITAPTLTFTGSITDVDDVDACYSESHKSQLLTADQVKAMYTSSCSREITVEISDNVESDNDCNWKITRTYNISDGGCNTDSQTMSVSGSDQTAPAIGTDDLNRTLTATNCVFTIPDMREIVRNISTDCSEITVTQPSAGMVVYPMVAERDTTVNVIVTDICGNSSVKEVIITIPAKVTISATATPATICYGATSQLTATPSNVVGTATYNWTPSDGLNNATIANPEATLTTTTTYTVEVTDENGCAATATTTVNVNPEVVMDAVDPMTLCVGDVTSYSFTTPLTVGTMSYAWTNSNTAIGLAANGDGDILSFTPTNTTNAPINATITVTPSHTYNDITCVGDPINFTITVRPSIKTPGNVEFACPADTTVVLSYSDCEQYVNIGSPEFVNNMSGMNVNITNDAPAGNIFPEGTTVVTWTATDECGDTLTCTQNVQILFPPCGDTIADFDGYRYSSVRIGCQCWTGENARSEHYSDGTPVDNFRYYNDSDSLENIYGKLYTWYTAVRVPEGDNNAEPSGTTDPFGTPYVQGICPEGWALPTVNEYMQMIANSGDATHAKDGSNLYWLPGYEGQPPFSGFDAYGAGKYNGAIDRYQELLGKTHFWTTLSGSGSETATTVEINYYCAEGLQTELSKGDGVSIRCIRKR